MQGVKPGFKGKLVEQATQYRTICFGFDQSYAKTGIAVAGITNKGQIDIIHVDCLPGVPSATNGKVLYRAKLRSKIYKLIRDYRAYGSHCLCVAEEVRVHSQGNLLIKNHLSWGALLGTMADTLWDKYGLTLSVADTRAWKKAVIGTIKPADKAPRGVDKKKWPTIEYIMHHMDVSRETLSQPCTPRAKKYTWIDDKGNKWTYDSDKADACAIAIYGLITNVGKLKYGP